MKSKVKIELEIDATPLREEIKTVNILIRENLVKKHVLFLKANRRAGLKTPDIKIDFAEKWEIKSPTKNGKYTIEHAVREGLNQSDKLIFNLANLKSNLPEEKVIRNLQKQFNLTRKFRKLLIINRERKVLTYGK